MEERFKKESSKDVGITFTGKIEFEGPIEEFEKIIADLGNLRARGLRIGTVPLPRDKARGVMIDTVPLPELPVEGLMIGTWPTPEHPAGGLMIDTVPLPERPPFPGVKPATRLLSSEMLAKIAKDMPRVKLIKNIYGGIRNPHLHINNEVVLLDSARFKEFVGQVATELGKGLLK